MNNKINLQPTLEDALVLLKPLQESDFDALYHIASDPKIWEQHPAKDRYQKEVFTRFFEEAIQTKTAFLILDRKMNEIIGSSRYQFVNESIKAIEIGWTFLAVKYWGGYYNKAIKKLMIEHALKYFEIVLFYIGENNFRSQKAVEKIGGQRISLIGDVTLQGRENASVIYAIERNQYFNQ